MPQKLSVSLLIVRWYELHLLKSGRVVQLYSGFPAPAPVQPLGDSDGVLMLSSVPFLVAPSVDTSAPSGHDNYISPLIQRGGGMTRVHRAGRLLLT